VAPARQPASSRPPAGPGRPRRAEGAARGLDATLDDIARHAGVNVATAYRHFANKHELALPLLALIVPLPARRD
jgi:hypothetical protein